MDHKIQEILLKTTQSVQIKSYDILQSLWSGYGKIIRIYTDKTSFIIKIIQPPSKNTYLHPYGWNTVNSHQRKIKSYQVERNWYQKHNTTIPNARTPQFIHSEVTDNTYCLILEDLKSFQFSPFEINSKQKINLCLKWLAYFHAFYLHHEAPHLWETGTYWHLDTRPDEFDALKDMELKKIAPIIDQKLKDSPFQTLVHGDAKKANFLINETEASAVDFQYVGKGVGVKDLAYFLSSVYTEKELFQNEPWALNSYFSFLKLAMNEFNVSQFDQLEEDWRLLYPYAWCDFYRFLQGWSPEHPKLHQYSEKMKNEVIKCHL